jgi:hypothetical protein
VIRTREDLRALPLEQRQAMINSLGRKELRDMPDADGAALQPVQYRRAAEGRAAGTILRQWPDDDAAAWRRLRAELDE